MRPLYFAFKVLIYYSVNLFFKGKKIVNAPKKLNAQTIFVVNHASAFMDPWVIAELQRPILFFLTRGDIFKTWLKPLTWASHMIPIYRTKENGADSAQKNEVVFKEVHNLLERKKSILIFGEGYTDDLFIRSLKPLKKGAARIGFGAMVASDWKNDIKIQCSGINYADPNEFRSEVLISNSKTIRLLDYKDEYLENPSKTISNLTKEITKGLQEQLTYLENAKLTPLHNKIQSITKKGIAHRNSDNKIDLITRWKYSKSLANFMNSDYDANNEKWVELEKQLDNYFSELSTNKIEDNWVNDSINETPLIKGLDWLKLIVGLPFFILGAFHHIIPYLSVKNFIENTFKRKVFWSGIKMLLGYLILSLFSMAFVIIINNYFKILPNWIVWPYIILVVPFLGVLAYEYYRLLKNTIIKLAISKNKLESLKMSRIKIVNLIETKIIL